MSSTTETLLELAREEDRRIKARGVELSFKRVNDRRESTNHIMLPKAKRVYAISIR